MVQGAIETGAALGMRSLDQHLAELLESGLITYEHAFEKCQSPANFAKLEAKYKHAGAK
jgi:twitching motility protein PilT